LELIEGLLKIRIFRSIRTEWYQLETKNIGHRPLCEHSKKEKKKDHQTIKIKFSRHQHEQQQQY
jgi:hypothetical protein